MDFSKINNILFSQRTHKLPPHTHTPIENCFLIFAQGQRNWGGSREDMSPHTLPFLPGKIVCGTRFQLYYSTISILCDS